MRLNMFAVLDLAVSAFHAPFFARSKGEAYRIFGDWVKDAQSPIGRHPEDYQLFEVGEFDSESGAVSGRQKVERIAVASDFEGPREVEVGSVPGR